MRILLIYPDCEQAQNDHTNSRALAEPLALEYLAAVAKQEKSDVFIFDMRLEPSALEQIITSYSPELVGVTSHASFYTNSIICICDKIKEIYPDCLISIGGHHATFMPKDFFRSSVDFVVTGQGLQAFRMIIQAYGTKQSFESIPETWVRTRNGDFQYGGAATPHDIDALPFPDRQITSSFRKFYYMLDMQPVALLRTSAGCPYKCDFCSVWKLTQGRYQKRKIENIIVELKQIQEPYIFLIDDEAFIDTTHTTSLFKAIQSSGIKKQYLAYCRIDTLIKQHDILSEWKNIGLKKLFVGVEAIVSDTLKDYNKKIERFQIEHALEISRNIGVDILAGFIVNPNFRKEDFKQLKRFIEHKKIRNPMFTVLTPLPGTKMMEEQKNNITTLDRNGRPDWNKFDLQQPVTKTFLPQDVFMQEFKAIRSLSAR
jgi:radical SAM superfamily enzyme YgiQ (UPF0313 family)